MGIRELVTKDLTEDELARVDICLLHDFALDAYNDLQVFGDQDSFRGTRRSFWRIHRFMHRGRIMDVSAVADLMWISPPIWLQPPHEGAGTQSQALHDALVALAARPTPEELREWFG